MYQTQLLIAGEWTPAHAGNTFSRVSSTDDTVASTSAAATVKDIERVIQGATEGHKVWSKTGPGARRALLLKAADLLESYNHECTERMVAEIGAARNWAQFNVKLGANMLREAGSATSHITGDVLPSDVPGSLAMGMRVPAGISLGIAPWNAPIILAARAVAMPIACGNAAILKGSEICPATQMMVAKALHEAGLPPGVISYVTHAPEDAADVVGALIDDPAVRRVNFTGSTNVGRTIAERAARALKPALLELGGKAPFVVLEDADLNAAVAAAAFGAFMNQGQICMSTERILVDARIADDFVGRLSKKAKTLKAADPRSGEEATLGALVSADTSVRIAGLMEQAVAAGAKVLTGGPSDTAIMQPTVVDHVTPDMALFREETFGPIVAITRFETVAQAIELANDTQYGLTGSVFCKDASRALAIAQQIESGICHVNGPTVHDEAHMPFGGVKNSGYGRFGFRSSIEMFTELRWVTMQYGPRHYPI
ncbi:MAG: aldehyde dehydrogenase family protein [Pseudomonadota bacterium]